MSKVIRQLKPLNQTCYSFENITGKLPSGVEFEIRLHYGHQDKPTVSMRGIEKPNLGQVLGMYITYRHTNFPNQGQLDKVVGSLLEKYPRINNEIEIYPEEAVESSPILKDGKAVQASKRFTGVHFYTRCDFFFDDEYIQFLSEFQENLEELVKKT